MNRYAITLIHTLTSSPYGGRYQLHTRSHLEPISCNLTWDPDAPYPPLLTLLRYLLLELS